ncbi:MAG: glycosyltransferase family 61 protein [Pirellula sp.]|jgi:hypothetical protein|nr:glycosyltransferase family 61 protein [Pirellula sp.]
MYQTIKQFRNQILGLLWSIQTANTSASVFPTRSESFAEWQSETSHGKSLWFRPGVEETIPALPYAGNWEAVQQALDSFPSHLRSVYLDDIDREWQIRSPDERVFELENGRALTNLGIVLTPDNVQINDLSGGSIYGLTKHKTNFQVRTLPPLKKLRGRVLLLASGLGQRNFYHWTAEMMPRIRLVRDAGIDFDHILIPKRHHYHRESLLLLGISPDKIVGIGKYAHIQAEALIATSKIRQELSSTNVRFLHDSMAGQAWSKTSDPNRMRIYIARRTNGWRSVVNERELINAITPLGFRPVFLEDLTYKQQIQLFQQSEFVIGPHGSGLVNLAYCNSGTRVIEIGTPVRPNVLFHIIAYHRGLIYRNFFGTAVKARNDESHIDVDVADLLSTLHELQEST